MLDTVTDGLAIYRLTRLIVSDTFPPIRRVRDRVTEWAVENERTVNGRREIHPLGELISCPWCSSVWVAVGVVAARRYAPRVWRPVATILAGSAVAGFLSEMETR